MNPCISAILLVSIAASRAIVAAERFKEPKTDAEWKAFCDAPDYMKTVSAIGDKEQRERVGSTCFRAPWIKFKPSEKKSW